MRKFFHVVFTLNFLYILLIAAQVAAIVFLCLYLPSVLPVALALTGVWAVSAVAAALLLCREGSAEVKCAFMLLIIILPLAGALIYLIAGAKKRRYGVLKVEGANESAPLSKAARAFAGTGRFAYEKAVYFDCGEKYFECLFNELGKAKKRIYIEYFIISRGKIFEKLLSALTEAGSRGVEIKIVCDGVGSAFRAGRREFNALKKLGAEIKIFHRITPLARARLNFRDHRKIAVIDGAVAFTGGINIADEYANISAPYGQWKDSGIAVYGSAAKVFEGMFLSVWSGEYTMPAPTGGGEFCIPFYDSPPHVKFCENAYIYAISSAKKRVHIMTPYFCAGEALSAALVFAARRGADVKVIIPHVPDKKYAFELSLANAELLSKSGIKFFRYTPGFMHAKCLICDGAAFLGSYNFDFRSAVSNFECGAVFGGKIAEDAEKDFAASLALSAPVGGGKISAPRKLYRLFLKMFSPLI